MIDFQRVGCDNHLQQGIVALLHGGCLAEGACRCQRFAQCLHAGCRVVAGVGAHLFCCGQLGAVGCDVVLQVGMRDVLLQVGNDVVTVPVLVGQVVEVDTWVDVNGGFVTVVEGLVVGQRGHDVANHIDVVAAGEAPSHPDAPLVVGDVLAKGQCLQVGVLAQAGLAQGGDGVGHGNLRDLCLIDCLLADGEQSLGQ